MRQLVALVATCSKATASSASSSGVALHAAAQARTSSMLGRLRPRSTRLTLDCVSPDRSARAAPDSPALVLSWRSLLPSCSRGEVGKRYRILQDSISNGAVRYH